MRATVKDVAERAGVSPKTVSNVINGEVFVRDDTRERVEKALKELDYVPNLSARGLRNGRSGVIALSLPDLATPYSGEMAHHFVEAAHARGWGVQIEETATRPEREDELLSRARSHLVDGLILNPVTLADSALARSRALPPVVLIGEVEQNLTDQVRVDSLDAARQMTQLLIDRGATSIAVVGSPQQRATATAEMRIAGYRQALDAAGIPRDDTLELSCPRWTTQSAATVVAEFLADHALPDAFFCFTDSLAIGTVSAIVGSGRRVPEDTLVAGFDDIEASAFTTPALTTVGFDKRAFADAALDRLAMRLRDRETPPQTILIPHRIIERASTRR
ncbi:MAG TPA: LacI family DNA-binding transcriptional regulator [Humibacter sp.]|nr:LacI family DNA-binding transcriptional regulator [Humibacter sp.]